MLHNKMRGMSVITLTAPALLFYMLRCTKTKGERLLRSPNTVLIGFNM